MSNKVVEVILHCQKRIKKEGLPEQKLLHYLGRLARLRITVADLAETGIGRTVNSLSRNDGPVGQAAETLVRNWKRMVSQNQPPEESSESNSSSSEEEEEEEEGNGFLEDDNGFQIVEDAEEDHEQGVEEEEMNATPELNSNNIKQEEHGERQRQQTEEAVTPSNSKSNRSSKSSSSSKDLEGDKKKEHHSSSSKHKEHKSSKHRDKEHESSTTSSSKHREREHGSSKHKEHRSSKHSESHSKSHPSKRSRDRENSSTSRCSTVDPPPDKSHKDKSCKGSPSPSSSKKMKLNGEVDSTQGVNFADVLCSLDEQKGKKGEKVRNEKWKGPLPFPLKLEPGLEPEPIHIKYIPRPSSSSTATSSRNLALIDDSNDLDGMLSARSQSRSKVFSGVKSGRRGEVPALFDLCMQVIKDNIGDLGFTGGIPYDILRPALERATPQQLLNIEFQNEHFIGETDELWQFHCKRDFRGQCPDETESWRELYERCKAGQQQKFEQIKKRMKKQIETAEPVRKAKLAYVETSAGPKYNREKAQTIKNGMKTIKLKEEIGVKRGVSSSASAGFNNPKVSGDPTKVIVEEATVIIAPGSRAGHAPAPPVSRESTAKPKPKKAPLMQKTMKLIRSLNRK